MPTEPGSAIRRNSRSVRKTDIGSLSPDSTSSSASSRSGSAAPARRNSTATAAASVGAAADPASSAPMSGTPSTSETKTPRIAAVNATPIVASTAAGQNAKRSIETGVLSPPSSRITASATLPIR